MCTEFNSFEAFIEIIIWFSSLYLFIVMSIIVDFPVGRVLQVEGTQGEARAGQVDEVECRVFISSVVFQVVLVVKNLPANAGDARDVSLIPTSRRSSGGGHGNPPQYSCLENPMDRGAQWATVHGVKKSQT